MNYLLAQLTKFKAKEIAVQDGSCIKTLYKIDPHSSPNQFRSIYASDKKDSQSDCSEFAPCQGIQGSSVPKPVAD